MTNSLFYYSSIRNDLIAFAQADIAQFVLLTQLLYKPHMFRDDRVATSIITSILNNFETNCPINTQVNH